MSYGPSDRAAVLAARLIARDSGLVDFEGQDISHWKSKELAKVMDQIKEIPLTEQLGDKAKGLQASAADLGREINKLKENLEAYVEGLKAKADK